MTHDEIMKLDERELWKEIARFLDTEPGNIERFAATWENWPERALWICYQAEEKLLHEDEEDVDNTIWEDYGNNLDWFFHKENKRSFRGADKAHYHPKIRAQAILLTIEDTKGGNDGLGKATGT